MGNKLASNGDSSSRRSNSRSHDGRQKSTSSVQSEPTTSADTAAGRGGGSNGKKRTGGGRRRGSRKSMTSSESGGAWSQTGGGDSSKGVSCPNLTSKRVTYEDEQLSNGVTIYRSYSSVAKSTERIEAAEARRQQRDRSEISVYRNTLHQIQLDNAPGVDGRRDVTDTAGRSQTLPRSFGRSRNQSASAAGHNDGTVQRQRGRRPRVQRQSAIELNDEDWLIEPLPPPRVRNVRRAVSRAASITGSRYRVCDSDLPDTGAIKRRTTQFSQQFTRDLVHLFTDLTDTVQLNTLSVAIRTDRENQQISLWQYLNSPDIPANLHRSVDDTDVDACDYVITVPASNLADIMAVRRDPSTSAICELVRCLVTELAVEGAAELARVFEYQLSLLPDGLPVELVAGHAARCVIDYVTCCGRHLDCNSIVLGVVRGRSRTISGSGPLPILSVVLGERELKWRVDEVFKKPALRKETMLFVGEDMQVLSRQPPWRFMTSPGHNPELYGYRGLILERSFIDPGLYRLNDEDEAMFVDEVCTSTVVPDVDFHQTYRPYRRLIGDGVLVAWSRSTAAIALRVESQEAGDDGDNGEGVEASSGSASTSKSLQDFVRLIHGRKFDRDEMELIQRSLQCAGLVDDRSISPSNIDDDFLLRTVWSPTAPETALKPIELARDELGSIQQPRRRSSPPPPPPPSVLPVGPARLVPVCRDQFLNPLTTCGAATVCSSGC